MADQVYERQIDADLGEFEFRAAPDGDGLTLAGYIARFAEPTAIDDWAGTYTEEIKRGAFARTIAERGPAKIKMQFNHGHDSAFGALPIGVWTELREDRKGLWGEGRIHDNWHTIPIRHAIESGALDGMSFKFKVVNEQVRKAGKPGELDHRTLTEVALFEAGVVVHPAYEGTTVGLRSAMDLYRSAVRAQHGSSATLTEDQTAAVPVDGTDPATRTVADPPVGITRRELRRLALPVLFGDPNVEASGDAA